jgi:hypothetical protein
MAMYGSRLTRLLSFDDDLRYLLLWNALFCSCRCDTGRKEGLQYFPVHPTQHRGPVKHTNNIYSIARSSFSQSRAFTNLECRSQTRRAIESMKTGRNARIDTGRCQRLLQYMFVSKGQLSGKNQSAHSAVPLSYIRTHHYPSLALSIPLDPKPDIRQSFCKRQLLASVDETPKSFSVQFGVVRRT